MSDQEEQDTSTGFDNEMAEILESCNIETKEIMEKLGQELLELEKRPGDA